MDGKEYRRDGDEKVKRLVGMEHMLVTQDGSAFRAAHRKATELDGDFVKTLP